jgi:hypothetical protein
MSKATLPVSVVWIRAVTGPTMDATAVVWIRAVTGPTLAAIVTGTATAIKTVGRIEVAVSKIHSAT